MRIGNARFSSFYYRNSCFEPRYQQLSPGELLGTPNVIRNFDSVTGCCSAVLGPEHFSADGTKAFEIGSNVLNLVFGDGR